MLSILFREVLLLWKILDLNLPSGNMCGFLWIWVEGRVEISSLHYIRLGDILLLSISLSALLLSCGESGEVDLLL